jgi:hypothetical protein
MFRGVERQLSRANEWITFAAWIRANWPSVVAVCSALGLGSYAASAIETIHALGWGAWIFLGAFFAVTIALAAALLAHAISVFRRKGRIEDNSDNAADGKDPGKVELEKISHRKFINEKMVLSGKSYKNCTFENVTIEYNGGPYEMVSNLFIGKIWLDSHNKEVSEGWRLMTQLGFFKGDAIDADDDPIRQGIRTISKRSPSGRSGVDHDQSKRGPSKGQP